MEEKRIKIVVPEHKVKERIDTYLTREIAHVSRSQIKRLIKDELITIDGHGVKTNHLVQASEQIEIVIPKPCPPDIIPEKIPLDIVYEDQYLLVVNKKAGMVVHPAAGHPNGTLVNALLAHSPRLSSVNDPFRPGIVHRIDKDTSGLLIVAKNDMIHRALARQFMDKSTERCYEAIVWGKFKNRSGTIQSQLARSLRDRKKIAVSPVGKKAITHYKVLCQYPMISHVELQLGTGRTHQIRVHLSHMGHPVFGDQTYGGRGKQLGGLCKKDADLASELLQMMPRQALHAKSLGFIHPVTKKRFLLDSELPQDMVLILKRLKITISE